MARFPKQYPNPDLSRRLYQLEAGFSGELKVDSYLQKIYAPNLPIILTNLSLTLSPGYSFQIDTLILTKQTVFILEVKNIKGNLYFKSNPHHLLREIDGDETIMDCPITQLGIAKENLTLWLAQRGINVNVSGLVVLANQQAIVKEAPPNSPITYMKRLAIILREINQMPPIYKLSEIEMIAKTIQANQTPYQIYPLCDYFKIDPRVLKKGQLCSVCNGVMAYKASRVRYCNSCGISEVYDPGRIVKDWFMLISNSISNEQCRAFLKLRNSNEAYYILKTLQLKKVGKSIATKYYWPDGIKLE